MSNPQILTKLMDTKEYILKNLRKNVRETYEMPDLSFRKRTYDNPVDAFIETTTTTAGAKLMEIKAGDDINQKIREAYPDAKIIASNIPGIEANLNPDSVAEAQELEKTDVGVIKGEVACAENGCVWIPQTMKEKAICFISECLVILVSRQNIVSNMHEAYERIQFNEYGFGTVISGPSKTADIEQSLVYGAQAARDVTIFLTD